MQARVPRAGFERLGLLPDAQARDIRRAYARELKKIDQALDAAGFQHLRDAYEAVLAYAGWQAERGAAPEVVPEVGTDIAVADIAPPPLPQATPHQLADSLADAFCITLARLAKQHDGSADQPWREALRLALADERLFGIEARHGFELRVAVILVRGWHPGHEALLSAAAAVFDWARETQLASLGQAGLILDHALDERAVFDSQGPSTQDAQRRVLTLLRQQRPASDAQIQQGRPAFMRMQARFPRWLPIVAPREQIAYWQERVQNLTIVDAGAAPALPAALRAAAPPKSRWLKPLLAILACLFAFVVVNDMLKHAPKPAAPAPVPARQSNPYPMPMIRDPLPPGQAGASYVAPMPAPRAGVAVTKERIHEIFTRIDYHPEKGEVRIAREVSFNVFLDVDGKAFGVNLIHSSGSPALDAAVKAAILGSRNFPPNTRKVFHFGVKYQPGTRSRRAH